jgi:hypothetical protein
LPCVLKKCTAKIVYRALSDAAHGKGASPCKMLPCALCRAPRQKTHDKGFAVRFKAFAVRSGRTTKPLFPVVPFKQRLFVSPSLRSPRRHQRHHACPAALKTGVAAASRYRARSWTHASLPMVLMLY